MARILIGTIIGLFIAFACVHLIEWVDAMLYTEAAAIDAARIGSDDIVERMPFLAKLLVVIGWCTGTLAGGAAAAAIAHRRLAAWIVAGFVVTGAAATLAQIRHPGWMMAAGLLLPWACAWLVRDAGRRPRTWH